MAKQEVKKICVNSISDYFNTDESESEIEPDYKSLNLQRIYELS